MNNPTIEEYYEFVIRSIASKPDYNVHDVYTGVISMIYEKYLSDTNE